LILNLRCSIMVCAVAYVPIQMQGRKLLLSTPRCDCPTSPGNLPAQQTKALRVKKIPRKWYSCVMSKDKGLPMRQLCSEMQNPDKKSDAKRYKQAR
jgi:hypothetical protein